MHLSTGENNCTFGERLKAERERLGFASQTALGGALEVSKKTIINWEQDTTSPDAQTLMRMHEKRFNINYLLFGSSAVMAEKEFPAYTPAEHAALAIRSLSLSDEDAKMLVQFARRLERYST